MSNTVLILTDIYNSPQRIVADAIESYSEVSPQHLHLTTKSGESYELQYSAEQMDQMLKETYFMVKVCPVATVVEESIAPPENKEEAPVIVGKVAYEL